MDNLRVTVIVGMLMAVLLSAFAAERLRICSGERRCLVESMPGLLPAARFFMSRAESRARVGQAQPQPQTHIQIPAEVTAEIPPQPTATTRPRLDPTVVRPGIRRDAEALAQPLP